MPGAVRTVGNVCQVLEIIEQTFHRWRNQYGRMKPEEPQGLNELEHENARLTKPLAEAELETAILREALEEN